MGTLGHLGVCKRCTSISQEILEQVTAGQWPIHAAPLVFQDWWHAALADGWQARELEREVQTKNAVWYLLEATLPTPYGLGTDRTSAAIWELRGELEKRDRALEAVWPYLEALAVSHDR